MKKFKRKNQKRKRTEDGLDLGMRLMKEKDQLSPEETDFVIDQFIKYMEDNKEEEPIEIDQDYFYMMSKRQTNRTSLPDYAFPSFRHLYDMMELLQGEGWQPGRIPVQGDFFVARQPYLRRFIERQEESLLEYHRRFKGKEKMRPSSKLSEADLKAFESRVFRLL